jgi:hypothetical protein
MAHAEYETIKWHGPSYYRVDPQIGCADFEASITLSGRSGGTKLLQGGGDSMGFQTEFNTVCKFKSMQELYDLLEYGRGKMVKSGFRVFPTGQKVIAYTPENKAIAIVKILASIAEINFQGEEVTQVEMELLRRLTDEEARIQTALAYEMFFGDQDEAAAKA